MDEQCFLYFVYIIIYSTEHLPHALGIFAAYMVVNMAGLRTAAMSVNVWQSLPGILCAWAENTWPAVGTVYGCGYDGQQIATICDDHGPCQTIRSILKPVFLPILTYLLCLQFSQMPRCPDLAILVTMTTDNRQTKPIALPLERAREVIMFVTHALIWH